MIKFIHNLTGTEMWVADERKEEYERAGHRLALNPSAEPTEVLVDEPEEVKEAPKKATTKKTSRAKKK